MASESNGESLAVHSDAFAKNSCLFQQGRKARLRYLIDPDSRAGSTVPSPEMQAEAITNWRKR
jgi:hypothetical protein